MIIVSACLTGSKCRYNGGSNTNSEVLKYIADKPWVPVCPEQLGGLAIPRDPAEIVDGTGEDVLAGKAKVLTKKGEDFTEAFIKGAQETLRIAQAVGATTAILKERSPSCGSCQIYNGTFQKERISGMGVTAALLTQHGIHVCNEDDLSDS